MSRPLFASRARVAEMLDIAPSTVDQYVRDGILPRPIYLTAGCARFDMSTFWLLRPKIWSMYLI